MKTLLLTLTTLVVVAANAAALDSYVGFRFGLGLAPGATLALGSKTPGTADQTADYDVSGAKKPSNLDLNFGFDAGWLITPEWEVTATGAVQLLQGESEVSSTTSALYTTGGASAPNQVGYVYNGWDLGAIVQYNFLHTVEPKFRSDVGVGLGGGIWSTFTNSAGAGEADWPSSSDSDSISPSWSYPDYGSAGTVPYLVGRIAADWASRGEEAFGPGAGRYGFGIKIGADVRYLLSPAVDNGTIGISGDDSSWVQLKLTGQPVVLRPFVTLYANFN